MGCHVFSCRSLLLSTTVLNDMYIYMCVYIYIYLNKKQPGCKKCEADQKQYCRWL